MADPYIEDVLIDDFLSKEQFPLPEFSSSITGILNQDKFRADLGGSGTFGASRKRDGKSYVGKDNPKSHRGIDISIKAGGNVNAPFSGTVTKIGYFYKDKKDNLKTRYVQISSDSGDHTFRFAYVTPNKELKKGDKIKKGSSFGVMTRPEIWEDDNISNHIHIEAVKGRIWDSKKRFDPSKILRIKE
jgi:hypothetical protein